jgi:hypothetical protein
MRYRPVYALLALGLLVLTSGCCHDGWCCHRPLFPRLRGECAAPCGCAPCCNPCGYPPPPETVPPPAFAPAAVR